MSADAELELFTRELIGFLDEEGVEDFIDFANEILSDFMRDEPSDFIPLGAHHYEWDSILHDNENVGIICARGHLKTSFVLTYMAWKMYTNKNFRAIYVSATLDQAFDKLEQFEEMCLSSWRLKHMMKGNTKDVGGGGWRSGAKYFSNGSRVHAASVGKALEGPHVHLIIMDDILQEFPNISDDRVINYVRRVVMPVRLPEGQLLLIGTQKRIDDAADWVKNSKNWETLWHPALLEDNTPRWPEYWTIEKLEKEKSRMGTKAFESEYMLNPLDPHSTVINWETLEACLDENLGLKDTKDMETTILGVDLAVGMDQSNDKTAYVVLSWDRKTNRRKILYSWCGTIRDTGEGWLRQQVDNISNLNDDFKPSKIVIETNGYQRLVAHEASKLRNLPIEGHNTGTEKHHTAMGVPGIALQMERGNYTIPWNKQARKGSTPGMKPLVDGLLRLTWGKNGRLEGHTPDSVVALWMCELGIQMMTKKTSFIKTNFMDIFKTKEKSPKKGFAFVR